MLVTVITTFPSCERIIKESEADFVGLGALGRPIPRSQGWMWAFWILFLLHGINVHNSNVTVSSVLIWVTVWSPALWEDGIMQGSKVFTGAKHLKE